MKKVLFLLLTALMLSGQWSTANAQGAIATNNNRVIVPITSGRNIPYVAFTGNIRVEGTKDYAVTTDADWLTVETTADGLRFSATANTADQPRTAIITLPPTTARSPAP